MDNFRQIIEESEQAVSDHNDEAGRFAILLDNQNRVCEEEQTSYDAATASRYSHTLSFTKILPKFYSLEIKIWTS